jgi:hypothetical protein
MAEDLTSAGYLIHDNDNTKLANEAWEVLRRAKPKLRNQMQSKKKRITNWKEELITATKVAHKTKNAQLTMGLGCRDERDSAT